MQVNDPICPRCGGHIPNNDQPGAHPGALSRVDDSTEVCSGCGVEEAVEQMANDGRRPTRENWVHSE